MAKDSDSASPSSLPKTNVGHPATDTNSENMADRLKKQRSEIGELKRYLKELEGRMVATRPISREKLPPMDMEVGGMHVGV